ncbi:MAG: TetR/AcrR family transcriptional regulator [Salinibacterium sp.]|nr:TetR/AcrR family transcriptional regulator [Salinibacterium sp.]
MPGSHSEAQPLRDALAATTRAQIVGAAAALFTELGYVSTSIGAIATRAGVAVQTIYNSVGNKAAVLSAVLDVAASGPNAPTPVPTFMAERTQAANDAAEVIAILADWLVEANTRTATIHWIIRQASAVDEDAAELERTRSKQRLHNYGLAAAALRERGGLRNGMTDEQAAATIWSLGHPTAYRSLVIDGGWSIEAYGNWLRGALESLG